MAVGRAASIRFLPGAQYAGDVHAFIPCFEVRTGDRRIVIRLLLSGSAYTVYFHHAQLGADDLNQLLTLYTLNRLASMVRSPGGVDLLESSDPNWLLDSGSVIRELDAVRLKECDYQQQEGRNLYCLAAMPSDETRIGSAGVLSVAPTSRSFCERCDLPDARFICSHLSHPEVIGRRAMQGHLGRHLMGALCELGEAAVGRPGGCHAAGHDCWEMLVDLPTPTVGAPPPLALPEALDFLDAVWRLVFGRTRGLIALTSVSEAAGISGACTTVEELDSRLADLGDLLDRLRVSADLLPPVPEAQNGPAGSLDRMEAALRKRLAGDSQERAVAGVEMLRQVKRLWNARHHSESAHRFPRILAEMGLGDVVPDWSKLWDGIRDHAVRGLMAIRTELRTAEETDSQRASIPST